MDKQCKIELLSPAGNFDAMLQAIHNGADAVYLGGTNFGARAYAGNFDGDKIKEAIYTAHLYDVNVYVTVNTLIAEQNTQDFLEYIDVLVGFGADGLIMQDLGMIDEVVRRCDVPVHASTQLNNTSHYDAEFLKSMGVERVVIARESALDTIEKTAQVMDTEVFIHGALCICYSGQCLFSAITLNRSGNEGRCAQNCRMKYSLLKGEIPQSEYKYLLSPKDMCLADNIGDLIQVNAASLKIEGRMKSPQYVGYITGMYRRLIDEYYAGQKPEISSGDIDTMAHLFNRGYTKGYLNGMDKDLMSIERPNHKGVEIGKVTGINKSRITIKLYDTLNQGDGIKFKLSDTGFTCNKIYNKGYLVSKGISGDTIQLDKKANTNIGDTLLLTLDSQLMDNLAKYDEKKIPIDISAIIKIDKPIEIKISDKNKKTADVSYGIVQSSRNKPVTRELIEESLSKLGNTPYVIDNIDIDMDENVFIPRSVINEARRLSVEALNKVRTEIKPCNRLYKQSADIGFDLQPQMNTSYSCKIENLCQYNIVKEYPFDRIYISDYNVYTDNKADKRLYYAVDSVNNDVDFTNERLLIGSTGNIADAQNNTVNADYLLNVRNSYSLFSLYKRNIKWVTLSAEVNISQAEEIIKAFSKRHKTNPNIEYIIYGRYQLMVTKHCAIGREKCGKCKTDDYSLEDIKGNVYPIVCDDKCCNHIYSKIDDKINSIQYLLDAGVNGFRLDFIRISDTQIVSACKRVFCD